MSSFELGRTSHDAVWNNPLGVKNRPVSVAEYAVWVSNAVQASAEGYPELSLLATQDESLLQTLDHIPLPEYPPRRIVGPKSALYVEPIVVHAYEHHGINIGQLQVQLSPRIQRGIGEGEWDSTRHRWDGLGDAIRRISGAISVIDEVVGDPVTPFTHEFPVGFVWDDEGYIAAWQDQINFGHHIIHPILPWLRAEELYSPQIAGLLESYAQGISDITSPISVECGYAYVHEEYGNIEYHPVTLSSYFLPQWHAKLSGSVSVDSTDNPIGQSIQRLETGDGLFERWNVRYMRPNRPDTADYMEVKIGTRTGKFFQYDGVQPMPNVRTVHGFQHNDVLGYYEHARKLTGSSMVQVFADMRTQVVSFALQRLQKEAQSASDYLTEVWCSRLNVQRGDKTRIRKYIETILSSFPASLASLT